MLNMQFHLMFCHLVIVQNLDTGKHCKYKQSQLFLYCQLPYLHFGPFALISLVLMKPVMLTNGMEMELCALGIHAS